MGRGGVERPADGTPEARVRGKDTGGKEDDAGGGPQAGTGAAGEKGEDAREAAKTQAQDAALSDGAKQENKLLPKILLHTRRGETPQCTFNFLKSS